MSCISNLSRINRSVYIGRKCFSSHTTKRMYSMQQDRMFRISPDKLLEVEGCHNILENANKQLSLIRLHSTSSILAAIKEKEISSTKKKYDSPLITLIDRDDKTSVLSLSQAHRLAKRRDLKLVKIEDPTLQNKERPLYKLLTGKEYFDEQISKKDNTEKDASGVKGEKTINMSGQIEKHDLDSKVKNIIKWLKKRQRVKVTISLGKSTEDERDIVMRKMEEGVTPVGGRLLQVREKGNNIKFYIEPPKAIGSEQETVTQIQQSD